MNDVFDAQSLFGYIYKKIHIWGGWEEHKMQFTCIVILIPAQEISKGRWTILLC